MEELICSARPVPAPGCVLSAQARVDMCPVCGEKPPPPLALSALLPVSPTATALLRR